MRKIIHLDDQNFFLSSVQQLVKKKIPDLYYLGFTGARQAERYIINSIASECPIGLIITDLNHPGIGGYVFAKRLKLIHRITTPILLLSMSMQSNYFICKGLENQYFNYYLHKSTSLEGLLSIIEKEVT